MTPDQIAMLVGGIVLFVVTLGLLVYCIVTRRSFKAGVVLFVIAIIMIAYPNITSFKLPGGIEVDLAQKINSLENSVNTLSQNVNEIRGVPAIVSSLQAQNKAFGPDISHVNRIDWSKIRNTGFSFVFIKATQGTAFRDAAFPQNWQQARSAGLVRGAYHFGDNSDGVQQADLFLSVVQPERSDLLALDFEQFTGAKTSMTISQAVQFVQRIHEKLGRYPIIYGGTYLSEQISSATIDTSSLQECPLWVPDFSGKEPRLSSLWQKWAFWQVTDSYALGDIGFGTVGLNFFNGTRAELSSFAGTR